MSNSDVMLFSKNDVILQSEGEGVKKGPKIAVILNVWPQPDLELVTKNLFHGWHALQIAI